MGTKPGRDQYGIKILRQKFVLVVTDVGAGTILQKTLAHVLVVIAAGDDVNVEILRRIDEILPAPKAPNPQFDAPVSLEDVTCNAHVVS